MIAVASMSLSTCVVLILISTLTSVSCLKHIVFQRGRWDICGDVFYGKVKLGEAAEWLPMNG